MGNSVTQTIEEQVSAISRFSVNLNGSYESPSRTETGRQMLRGQRATIHYLDDICKTINNYISFIFGHIPYSPCNERVIELFSELYCSASDGGIFPDNSAINTEVGRKSFFEKCEDGLSDGRNIIYVVGRKGSGKTFILNHFFSTEHAKLLEKGVIPLFIDMSKAYMAQRRAILKGLIKINSFRFEHFVELFSIPASYVVSECTPAFSGFWNNDNAHDDLQKIHDRFCRKTECEDGLSGLIHLYDRLKEAFEECDKEEVQWEDELNRSPFSDANFTVECDQEDCEDAYLDIVSHSYLYDSLMEKTLNIVFSGSYKNPVRVARLLFKAILYHIKKSGFSPLYVADGIDNLDYYKDEKLYKMIVDDLRVITASGCKVLSGMVVAGVRRETYSSIREFGGQYHRNHSWTFEVEKILPSLIIEKKISAALHPSSPFARRKKSDVSGKIDLKIEERSKSNPEFNALTSGIIFGQYVPRLDEFLRTCPHRLTLIFNSIFKKIRFDELTENELFDKLYDGNLRGAINNFLSIHSYARLRSRGTNPDFGTVNRSNFVYIEGLTLHGRLYLDTSEEPFCFGKVIYNPFWFDKKKAQGKWHGLCSIRILQLLDGEYSEKQTLKIISAKFNYEKEVVKQAISRLLSHGMIRAEYDEESSDRVKLTTSDKGRFILDLVFANINIFYFLSLDTPLVKKEVNNANQYSFHQNTINDLWAGFNEAAALSSLMLVRHIHTQHSDEAERMTEDDLRTFSLPNHFPARIEEQVCEKVINLGKAKKGSVGHHQYMVLRNKLKSLYNQIQ